MQGTNPDDVQPVWRPFQLAFILMNIPGIANAQHADREVVDLLFFPTGGARQKPILDLQPLHWHSGDYEILESARLD
jgi:hypothetical protein